ncbi:MAG: DUF1599 domain-containing protein [Bacteroidales bacterium]|nr:DUF1599 domain-containing protein [Bacteroidales bacterium]
MKILKRIVEIGRNVGLVKCERAERFRAITSAMTDLYERKNKDYGGTADRMYEEWGMTYYCIMLQQKIERLKSTINADEVNFEGVRDTLLDIANYAIMGIMSEENNY